MRIGKDVANNIRHHVHHIYGAICRCKIWCKDLTGIYGAKARRCVYALRWSGEMCVVPKRSEPRLATKFDGRIFSDSQARGWGVGGTLIEPGL